MLLPSSTIFFEYICPFVGCLVSAAMYAAPIHDLRDALLRAESLGRLNPLPWAFMTGNCLGWTAYGYWVSDPFIVASNVPGLILSLWLNMGASKLQYRQLVSRQQQQQQGQDVPLPITREYTSSKLSHMIMTSQESLVLTILSAWATILISLQWFPGPQLLPSPTDRAMLLGVLVNLNLLVFYGAPLQTIQAVIQEQNASSIHVPTMVMNWINTSFWMLYGLARTNPIIYVPNGIGLILSIAQGILKCLYSTTIEDDGDNDVSFSQQAQVPLLSGSDEEGMTDDQEEMDPNNNQQIE